MAGGFKTEDFMVCVKRDDLRDSSIITPATEMTWKENKHYKEDRSVKQLHNCMPMEIALATIFGYMKRRRESYCRIIWAAA